MPDFESLRKDYEKMPEKELKKEAWDLIGVSRELSHTERKAAIKEWYSNYDSLLKLGKKDRSGSAEGFMTSIKKK